MVWAFFATMPVGFAAGLQDADGPVFNAILMGTLCAFVVGIPLGIYDLVKARRAAREGSVDVIERR